MLPISSGSSVRKPYVAKAVSQSNIGPSATRKLSKATIAASQQSRSGSVAALAPTKKGAAALAIKKNDVKLTPTAFTMSMSRPASAASSTLTHPIRKYRSMDAIREENVPVTGNETVLPPSALRKNASRAQTPVTERKSVSFGNLTSIRNNKGDESEDEDDRSFELDAFVKPRRIIRAPTPGASKRPGSPKLKIPKDSVCFFIPFCTKYLFESHPH